MIKMESIFKEGDTVYHCKYGKGIISRHTLHSYYEVIFEGTEYSINESFLSFTPYTLEKGGFSQVRPETEIEVGQLIWVKDEGQIHWNIRPFLKRLDNAVSTKNIYAECEITWSQYSLTNPYDPELPCFKK
jgi:hypothetical protein